jgi:hypothetical protein
VDDVVTDEAAAAPGSGKWLTEMLTFVVGGAAGAGGVKSASTGVSAQRTGAVLSTLGASVVGAAAMPGLVADSSEMGCGAAAGAEGWSTLGVGSTECMPSRACSCCI